VREGGTNHRTPKVLADIILIHIFFGETAPWSNNKIVNPQKVKRRDAKSVLYTCAFITINLLYKNKLVFCDLSLKHMKIKEI